MDLNCFTRSKPKISDRKIVISFDKHKFHGIKLDDGIYVSSIDVRDFINPHLSTSMLEITTTNLHYSHAFSNNNVKYALIEGIDHNYINWIYVPYLTMKYDNNKYLKYKSILERELNYREVENDEPVIDHKVVF